MYSLIITDIAEEDILNTVTYIAGRRDWKNILSGNGI